MSDFNFLSLDYQATTPHACKGMDPDVFYPTSRHGVAEAIAICDSCPVEVTCLKWALGQYGNLPELDGIWGGKSEKQRARLLRLTPTRVERMRARRTDVALLGRRGRSPRAIDLPGVLHEVSGD